MKASLKCNHREHGGHRGHRGKANAIESADCADFRRFQMHSICGNLRNLRMPMASVFLRVLRDLYVCILKRRELNRSHRAPARAPPRHAADRTCGLGAMHVIDASFAGRAASGKLSGVRRALNVIGTVLLLICLASMLRWVGGMRSDRDRDGEGIVRGTDQRAIGLYCGVFYDFHRWFGREDIRAGGPLPKATEREFSWGFFMPENEPHSTSFGFSSGSGHGGSRANGYWGFKQWSFPVWPVAILCLLPALRRRWVARRVRISAWANRCHTCGYDLRATPDRCPECGTVPLESVC